MESGKVINGGSREIELWEGPNFKELPRFWKVIGCRVLTALQVIKTKLLSLKVVLYSCYIEDHVNFAPFSYICMPAEFKADICSEYLKKYMQILPCIWQTRYITDSNTTFRSRSRGSLVDSDSWLVATTPGDPDSAPLLKSNLLSW